MSTKSISDSGHGKPKKMPPQTQDHLILVPPFQSAQITLSIQARDMTLTVQVLWRVSRVQEIEAVCFDARRIGVSC